MFDVTKALGVTGVTLYFRLAITLDVTKALGVTGVSYISCNCYV